MTAAGGILLALFALFLFVGLRQLMPDPKPTTTADDTPATAPSRGLARPAATSEDEWEDLLAFTESVRTPPLVLTMDQLVDDRARTRRLLALVSTFPQVPDTQDVERLLLGEHHRLETEIARRLIAGIRYPRYSSPDSAA